MIEQTSTADGGKRTARHIKEIMQDVLAEMQRSAATSTGSFDGSDYHPELDDVRLRAANSAESTTA